MLTRFIPALLIDYNVNAYVGGLSPGQRVMLGLRRTFQQELVVDELTARENIQALADHVCASRQQAREEIERALSFTGIAGRAHVLGRQLNLFERRLIEIGKT